METVDEIPHPDAKFFKDILCCPAILLSFNLLVCIFDELAGR